MDLTVISIELKIFFYREERNELSGEKVELPNVVYNLEDAVVCNVRVVSV